VAAEQARKAAYRRGFDEGFEKGYGEGLEGHDAMNPAPTPPPAPKGLVAVVNELGEVLHIHPSTLEAHRLAGWRQARDLPRERLS
jgi:hypothetical protein